MADKPKMVRGTLDNGAVVQTTEENAARLGVRFTSDDEAAAKKSPAKKSSDDK